MSLGFSVGAVFVIFVMLLHTLLDQIELTGIHKHRPERVFSFSDTITSLEIEYHFIKSQKQTTDFRLMRLGTWISQYLCDAQQYLICPNRLSYIGSIVWS